MNLKKVVLAMAVLALALFGSLAVALTVVQIDIKPGSDTNDVNLNSGGMIPVLIVTSESFDAVVVDPSTLKLDEVSPFSWIYEDRDGDGDVDLLVRFRLDDLDLDVGVYDLTLSAETFDGEEIVGVDFVNVSEKGMR